MIQRLNRNLTGPEALQPGEYATHVVPHIAQTHITVTICCPLCGGKKQLDHRHVVARDGRVTPALACPSCPFFDRITLDGFGEVPR